MTESGPYDPEYMEMERKIGTSCDVGDSFEYALKVVIGTVLVLMLIAIICIAI